ncbi:Glutathione transport system permease protein GsiC [bacterium HR23]|nr:Glutathione transport system permease protein GsiC [bacterium HR23]
MQRYLARRLLIGIPTLLGATIFAFILLRVIPGAVATELLGGAEGIATGTTIEKLRRELGLDRPLVVQYVTWLADILRGDFGTSMWSGKSVGGTILSRLPFTLQLAIMAELFSLLIGIPIGIMAAIRQDTWIDYGLRFWSIFFLAVPTFWLGLLVIMVGVAFFQWSPPLGYNTFWQAPGANLSQMIFPALILASHESARIGRMTRSSMLEVLREDYIRTARAKGLREAIVVLRHALKNALIPIVTFTSVYFGALMGGVVVLEAIFNIPGLGTLFLESIRFRDYTVVQAMVFFLATVFIVINLVVDIMYGWLDPRIRYE